MSTKSQRLREELKRERVKVQDMSNVITALTQILSKSGVSEEQKTILSEMAQLARAEVT